MLTALLYFWLGGVLSSVITVMSSNNPFYIDMPPMQKAIRIAGWPWYAGKKLWPYIKGFLGIKS